MAEWWKAAKPFWSTAAKHGRKVAMLNWHDCFLPGKGLEKPTDCRPFEKRAKGTVQPRAEIAVQERKTHRLKEAYCRASQQNLFHLSQITITI